MHESKLIKIARQVSEELRNLPAGVDVSANGTFVRLVKPGGILVAECVDEDGFLVGHEEPPVSGGFPVRVIAQPRVSRTRAETVARAREWAGT